MRKRYLNPKELYEPRFFTHSVAISGPATLVQVSGQVAYDRDGVVVGKGDFRAQCEQVFRSLTHALRAAGATWSDVVKMNGYMVETTTENVNTYREVRMRYLDPARLPASTLVGVTRLVHEHLLLEVEVAAALATPPAKRRARRKRR